ncbi:MAG TPA: peptide ABC transporter substrate-binding protein [Dehalococcoidia bacterium]|nr:peptide ABC transporter substrate-binding protein [Dehalococcoidia bacterium]
MASGIVVLAGLWYTTSRPSKATPPLPVVTYSEGVAGTFNRINPLYDSFNAVDSDLTALIYSGLTRLGPDGEVHPDLAESWDISSNGLTYTFHLRPQVVWHDGEPFDADDVVFTYNATQAPGFRGEAALKELFRSISVTKVDDTTVTLRLNQPFAPLLAHLSVGILPKHLLGSLDAEALYSGPFNQQPVGTGPFSLAGISSEHAILDANPVYYFGEPSLRRFELRFYPDEPSLLRALKDGNVKGAFFRSPLDSADLRYLESGTQWQVLHLPSTTFTILYFNNAAPPLQDRKLRQALAYATDREQIVAGILDNQAVQADSAIPTGMWAYSAVLDRYPYDPVQATKLLDEDGWLLGPNGVRAKDGEEIRLSIVTNEDSQRLAIALAIARSWSALGVPTDVSTQGPTTLLRDFLTPRLFLVALYGYDSGPDPDPYPAYHTSQARPGGDNLSSFSNPDADILLQTTRQTSDTAARLALYRQFQEVFASELPTLPLYQRTFTYVVDKHLKGLGPLVLFDSSSRFTDVREWRTDGG